MTSEQSIASARASVMIYDDGLRKWVPSGTSSGLSKVHIYQHVANCSFRVVGRKLQDHEVVINCSVLKTLKYNQATPTFHQWRDCKQSVYGLNFSSKEDADNFAAAMLHAIQVLNSPPPQAGPGAPLPPTPSSSSSSLSQIYSGHQPPTPPVQPIYQSVQGMNGDWEDPYSRGVQDLEQDPRIMPNMGQGHNVNPNASMPSLMGNAPPTPPMSAPGGHHRTSSAPPNHSHGAPPPPPPPPPNFNQGPPAPPPPPVPSMSNGYNGPPPMAPGPPLMSNGGGAPPPPPPPPMMLNSGESLGSLASALSGAKLKKRQSVESIQSANSGSSGTYSTLGRSNGAQVAAVVNASPSGGGGLAGMMDEMTKTLARRRAIAERKEVKEDKDVSDGQKPREKTSPGSGSLNGTRGSNTSIEERYGKTQGANGSQLAVTTTTSSSGLVNGDSAKSLQRRTSSTSEEGVKTDGGDADAVLAAVKQEMMRELRAEISQLRSEMSDELHRIKMEIIEGKAQWS
ncbi:unnamed protein product [Notodromas monacha]|uniref:WH1 domain-containing protein n=1 Tax=Notodromas monacha TaxID=399045 RepID=A0A7R9BGA8_9CRUS|nr:unnamed protein product [Notodromas monacha]CAG0914079.1 unnamed protein product [Notodromas monacha]